MYIEGLGKASIANGVLRIETFYRNARGEDINGPDLIIPAIRVSAIAGSLESLIGKLREHREASPLAAETAE